jgi:hypothetical protein
MVVGEPSPPERGGPAKRRQTCKKTAVPAGGARTECSTCGRDGKEKAEYMNDDCTGWWLATRSVIPHLHRLPVCTVQQDRPRVERPEGPAGAVWDLMSIGRMRRMPRIPMLPSPSLRSRTGKNPHHGPGFHRCVHIFFHQVMHKARRCPRVKLTGRGEAGMLSAC